MPRGFLKDVGGIKRLRMVKEGFDANNLNLPYNAVVFDSVFPRNLSIYSSGVVPVETAMSDARIAAWTDPGYIPMTICVAGNVGGWNSVVPWTSSNPVCRARRDGLYLSTGSFNLPVLILYFAFRVAG